MSWYICCLNGTFPWSALLRLVALLIWVDTNVLMEQLLLGNVILRKSFYVLTKNSLLVENIEYMTSPCTFVEILQPRRLLTKKQNGLCCGYLSGFLVAQKTKRARGNSEVYQVPKTWIFGLASHREKWKGKLNKAFLHILRQIIYNFFKSIGRKLKKSSEYGKNEEQPGSNCFNPITYLISCMYMGTLKIYVWVRDLSLQKK